MSGKHEDPADEQLLREIYDSDHPHAAWITLEDRYKKKLAGFLRFMVRDDDVVEALLHEVWTAVYLARRQGRKWNSSRGSVESYLLALAGVEAHRWLTAR